MNANVTARPLSIGLEKPGRFRTQRGPNGDEQRDESVTGPLPNCCSLLHSGFELANLPSMADHGLLGEAMRQTYLMIKDHPVDLPMDQSSLPFWERPWIAPELEALLFDQPAEGPVLRTYLVLDATLRAAVTGWFDLDSVDVPVQSLFNGKVAEDLKEGAPYLVDLTLPDDGVGNPSALPGFHRDFFANHWGRNTGIFVRTAATMAEVRAHFRRFPRIQVEQDRRWDVSNVRTAHCKTG